MIHQLSRQEKIDQCVAFFRELSDLLKDSYEIVPSCNADISQYLIPKGSIDKLSYSSKPERSFRISDHWNWFANLKKNADPHYIQCYSVDAPRAKKRVNQTGASKPVDAIQVGYFDPDDHRYHAVFGEVFDRKTKTWEWLEADPQNLLDWGLV